jgi:hypothetical protein
VLCIAGRSGRSYEAPTRLCPPLQKHPNAGMEGFDVSLPQGFQLSHMSWAVVVAWEVQQLTSIRRGSDRMTRRRCAALPHPSRGAVLRVAATGSCGVARTARCGGSRTEAPLTSVTYYDGGAR